MTWNFILEIILVFIIMDLLLLISVFFTILECQLLSVIQRWQGSSIVELYGLFHVIIKRLKILGKKIIIILNWIQARLFTVISASISTYIISINLNFRENRRYLTGMPLVTYIITGLLLGFSNVEYIRHDIRTYGALHSFFLDSVRNLKQK